MFSYVQTQKYSLEIILNSRFLFQDVAIMLFGAIACLVAVQYQLNALSGRSDILIQIKSN